MSQNEATGSEERWMQRGIVALIVVVAGLMILPLGRAGLWEPWEMDRADLARTFFEPALVPTIVGANQAEQEALFIKAADAAEVRLSFVSLTGQGSVRAGRALKDLIQTVRGTVVSGALIDLDAVIGVAPAAGELKATGRRLADLCRLLPNGNVILVSGKKDLGKLEKALTDEIDRADYAFRVDRFKGMNPSVRKTLLEAEVPELESPVSGRVVLLQGPTETLLTEVLQASANLGNGIVRFKKNGVVHPVPPLQTWLMTTSYAVFGYSEFATRLPGALMALLGLILVVFVTRRLWGTRIALFTGAILATTPLFYGQAISAVGEAGGFLGLTLFGAGLLLWEEVSKRRVAWVLIGTGLFIGFLAKGLYAPLMYAIIGLGLPMIRAQRDIRAWLPGIVCGLFLGLMAFWVFTSSPVSYAGQFRFTSKLFGTGLDAYSVNFDYFIRHVGFGAFPWSPLYLVAFAWLLFAEKGPDRSTIVLLLWFAVPLTLMMWSLREWNHFLWPATAAGAVAVAVFLSQITGERFFRPMIALFMFFMVVILVRELGKSPEPLASFLTFDPPFAKKGSQRFPETLALSRLALGLIFVAGLLVVLYFAQVGEKTKRLRSFLRRSGPFNVSVGVSGFIIGAYLLIRAIGHYSNTTSFGTVRNALGPTVNTFPRDLLFSFDPVAIVLWLSILGLGGALLVRLVTSRWNVQPKVWSWWLGAGSWLALLLVAWFSVVKPAGYMARLTSGWSLLLTLVILGGFGVWTLGRKLQQASPLIDWRVLCLAAGLLGLNLGGTLVRDAGLTSWLVLGLVIAGWLGFFLAILPTLLSSRSAAVLVAGSAVGLVCAALAFPVLDQLDRVSHAAGISQQGSWVSYLVFKDKITILLYLPLIGLLLNRAIVTGLGERLFAPDSRLGRYSKYIDHGWTMTGGLLAAAALFTVAAIGSFYPTLAENVSQKHILDTYRNAENLASNALGDRLFRYGSFARAGAKDTNFYTAAIPAIRNRQSALKVLLGQQDQSVDLTYTDGRTEERFVPAWSDKNDLNGDGTRDWPTLTGLSTEVGPGFIKDEKASFTVDAHRGKVVMDAAGSKFEIVGNDATTLKLKSRTRIPAQSGTLRNRGYLIDAREAVDHRATAQAPRRSYMLLPASSFSQFNYDFRLLSGGRPVPVINAKSYRILLATSYLREGEKQQNRYALHTITREEFDRRKATQRSPEIRGASPGRIWGNLGDNIHILGYDMDSYVVSRGNKIVLRIYMQCVKKLSTSYKVFMHIEAQANRSRMIGDHWPLNLIEEGEKDKSCVGCYQTNQWLPGDVVIDVYEKEVPMGTPSGGQNIWFGLFRPSGGKRLPVKRDKRSMGTHDRENRLMLGTFQVR